MAVSSNTVLGKYRIIREIARSNDIVYEAIDPTMARRVAVKELQLPPHLAGAQKRERIERFYREAKAAGTLSHRNIVTIHDVGQENDRHFLVMEYLEGQSLRDILQMQGALPLKETVEITLQLCDALAYAHSRGVVHRDIKPDNVHILPGGIIKLTDFGIARITAEPSITTQGQVFGTPSYMSPEQVASHTVDHRTDLFSLGITLYEMLTGRKPFVGDSVITITYNIMNNQPTMPVGVPLALQQILQRALAKDPNLRYQNAAAMAADLRAEKFALTSPPPAQAAHVSQPTPLTFSPGPPLTMETGTVPAEISGMPVGSPYPSGASSIGTPSASAPSPSTPSPSTPSPSTPAPSPSPAGAQAYSSQVEPTQAIPPPPAVIQAREDEAARDRQWRRSGFERFVGLVLPILALLALIALIVWGILSVVSALHAHAKHADAASFIRPAPGPLPSDAYVAAAPPPDAATSVRTGQPPLLPTRDPVPAPTAGPAPGPPPAAPTYPTGNPVASPGGTRYDPTGAAALNAQANAAWQAGRASEALDAWERAAQADPTSQAASEARRSAVGHYRDMAQAAAAGGRVAEARTDWQKITQIDPGSDEAVQAAQSIGGTDPEMAPATPTDAGMPGVGMPR